MANKKGNISIDHNLYNIVGSTLLDGLQQGRINPNIIKDASINLGVNLGGGFNFDAGINQYMGNRKQDLKIGITKDFG